MTPESGAPETIAALGDLIGRVLCLPARLAGDLAGEYLAGLDLPPAQAADGIEISVRVDQHEVRGRRLLLEGVGIGLVGRAARIVGPDLSPPAMSLAERIGATGARLYLGWDLGGAGAVLKLYADAHRLPAEQRGAAWASLCRALALPPPPPRASVLGLNLAAGRAVAGKWYEDVPDIAADLPAGLLGCAALASVLAAAGRLGEGVISREAGPGLPVRAVHLAVAWSAPLGAAEPLLPDLLGAAGLEGTRVGLALPWAESALGFVTCHRQTGTLSLYWKPRLPGCLPPAARMSASLHRVGGVFAAADLVVSVVVRPARPGALAWAEVGPLALEWHLVAGQGPAPIALLLDWAAERLRRHGPRPDLLTPDPPPPWRRVAAAAP